MILAKTVKGWTLGPGVEARNITHQAKKLTEDELKDLPRPARAADPRRDSSRTRRTTTRARLARRSSYLLRARGRRSAAPLPRRVVRSRAAAGAGRRGRRRVRGRQRDAGLDDDGLHPAPAQPDPRPGARAADRADHPGRGAHLRHGPAVQGGRDLRRRSASATSRSTRTSCCRTARRPTARSSRRGSPRRARWPRFQAAGTSYATHGLPMIPFYIFYSMFGFQRTGDQMWAFGDARGRGFLMGATAGRTTLTGEGLQHDDGHSQILAVDRARTSAPTTRRSPTSWPRSSATGSSGCTAPTPRTSSTTSRSTTRTTPSRPRPEGVTDEAILRGIYRFAAAPDLGPRRPPGPARRVGLDPPAGARGARPARREVRGRGRDLQRPVVPAAPPRRPRGRALEPAPPRREDAARSRTSARSCRPTAVRSSPPPTG